MMSVIKTFRRRLQVALLLPVFLFLVVEASAQTAYDTIKVKSLYKPPATVVKDTLPISDSLLIRQQFIFDSIQTRLAFIRDSIVAREQFVRDSIARRQRILDSLNFLKTELPGLLEAAVKAIKDEIIIDSKKLIIIGDSSLSNYSYQILPFSLSQPFTPWKSVINLSDNPIKIGYDANSGKISSVQSPAINCSFVYGRQKNILRINQKGIVLSRSSGNLYKESFDSAFYDSMGRLVKIKRYNHFHQTVNNYQKGAPLFIHLLQVKQYEYNKANQLTAYEVINFCDRLSGKDENKVCNIINYSYNIQGNTYYVARKNNPANNYSDGTFTIEFDGKDNLKSLAFKNISNTENWKTHVEVNEEGNVVRYLYEINGKINQTLDFNYYLNDPRAKYPVEIIKCSYEDDGISYFQNNTTTGKSRTRDRTTGEWSSWR